MSVEPFVDKPEPSNQKAIIWRYLQFWKLEDLLKNRQLYFRRADLLSDEREGIPPDGYERILNLDRYDIHDSQELTHHIGYLAQLRQSMYVNCWHLHTGESISMWRGYGEDGVAISTTYSTLRNVLMRLPDRILLGLIRYGSDHLTEWNAIRFITTKRVEFSSEKEVRALVWVTNVIDGMNRHFDASGRAHDRPIYRPPEGLSEGIRRAIDPNELIKEVIISPFASKSRVMEVNSLLSASGIVAPVRVSTLSSSILQMPSEEDLRRYT